MAERKLIPLTWGGGPLCKGTNVPYRPHALDQLPHFSAPLSPLPVCKHPLFNHPSHTCEYLTDNDDINMLDSFFNLVQSPLTVMEELLTPQLYWRSDQNPYCIGGLIGPPTVLKERLDPSCIGGVIRSPTVLEDCLDSQTFFQK